MGLKIVCSGHLVRYPLGGHSWHHLQYLVGLQRLGHQVTFFEHYGWPNSCYDPARNMMISDPSYGIGYTQNLLRRFNLDQYWCYLAEDGTTYGITRARLSRICRESDLYLNLSNINWIPELEQCKRRVLVDTDPVFTQMGLHGLGGPFSRYHVLFTYGENVHRPGCQMPTGGIQWVPTRQPVVLDLWPEAKGNPSGSFTTVMNWTPLGERANDGVTYGQKDREFERFFSLPRDSNEPMELAVHAPLAVRKRLADGGWRMVNPIKVTQDPWVYQNYIRNSRAEFSVAKHGYVATRCGWFSERSTSYLASRRPVLVQDTGFSEWLPTGQGVLAFKTTEEAIDGIHQITSRYELHCRRAREIVEEYFDSRKVLTNLIEQALHDSTRVGTVSAVKG
jgi:hypothetical protein